MEQRKQESAEDPHPAGELSASIGWRETLTGLFNHCETYYSIHVIRISGTQNVLFFFFFTPFTKSRWDTKIHRKWKLFHDFKFFTKYCHISKILVCEKHELSTVNLYWTFIEKWFCDAWVLCFDKMYNIYLYFSDGCYFMGNYEVSFQTLRFNCRKKN